MQQRVDAMPLVPKPHVARTALRQIAPNAASSPSASATQLVHRKLALPKDALQLLALRLLLRTAATLVDALLLVLKALVEQTVHSPIAAFVVNSRRVILPLTAPRENVPPKDALQLLALYHPQQTVATLENAHLSVITRPVAPTVQGLTVPSAVNSRRVILPLTALREHVLPKDALQLLAHYHPQQTVATLENAHLSVITRLVALTVQGLIVPSAVNSPPVLFPINVLKPK